MSSRKYSQSDKDTLQLIENKDTGIHKTNPWIDPTTPTAIPEQDLARLDLLRLISRSGAWVEMSGLGVNTLRNAQRLSQVTPASAQAATAPQSSPDDSAQKKGRWGRKAQSAP